jgi:iron complex transport system substrate-binding protein
MGLLCGLFTVAGVVSAADASRVISVGGAVTETVYRLGRAEALVAVDSTSTWPEAARELPDVGYMRQLSAEPILSLRPDHVIAAAGAGPPVIFEQLRDAGVRVTRVPDTPSAAGVVTRVKTVARALGVEPEGRRLATRLETRFERLRARVASVETRPTAVVLIAAGAGNLMAAGRDTTAEGLLGLAGAGNAVDAWSGYRPLSAEAMIEAAPEWIVLTEAALEALGGREGVRAHAALGATPAARDGRILAMDGLLLLGFGPRTPAAAQRLAARLHPALSSDRGD